MSGQVSRSRCGGCEFLDEPDSWLAGSRRAAERQLRKGEDGGVWLLHLLDVSYGCILLGILLRALFGIRRHEAATRREM